MSSSAENAMERVRKWRDAKAHIMASFVGQGLTLKSETGRVVLDEQKGTLALVSTEGDEPAILMSLSLRMSIVLEDFETLLDAPDKLRFSLPFISAVSFKVPCGAVDLREMP
jgi:hypothetical protein